MTNWIVCDKLRISVLWFEELTVTHFGIDDELIKHTDTFLLQSKKYKELINGTHCSVLIVKQTCFWVNIENTLFQFGISHWRGIWECQPSFTKTSKSMDFYSETDSHDLPCKFTASVLEAFRFWKSDQFSHIPKSFIHWNKHTDAQSQL